MRTVVEIVADAVVSETESETDTLLEDDAGGDGVGEGEFWAATEATSERNAKRHDQSASGQLRRLEANIPPGERGGRTKGVTAKERRTTSRGSRDYV